MRVRGKVSRLLSVGVGAVAVGTEEARGDREVGCLVVGSG